MKRLGTYLAPAVMAVMLGACGDPGPADLPLPRELTREAIGHYCGMIVADHKGPKAQIFLRRQEEPVWFSSVRDAVVYTLLPEEPKAIVAIYVSDMAKAVDFDKPAAGPWIEARAAWFVVESAISGGMGAPEAMPFSSEAAAREFAAKHGGRVVRFDGIDANYVLSPVEPPHQQHRGKP